MNWIQKAISYTGKSLLNFATKSHGFTVLNSVNGHFNFSQFSDKKNVHESYLANDDVYAMLSTAAGTMANNIEWNVFKVDRSGEEEQVFDTELNRILLQPNAYQSQMEWREQAYIYLMLTGKSFIGGLESVGFRSFTSLHNLPSQVTTFKFGDLSQPITKYIVDWELQREWMPENVLFTKYVNVNEKDFFNGLSPLQAGNKLLQSSNNLVEADASVLKNRGASGMLTSRGDDVMLPEEKKQMQKALDDQLGGANKFNKIIASSANVDFLQFGLSPNDLKLIESDISKRRRFANIWGFDSSLFNDPANKTFNNRKEATKAAYENVYIPNDNKLVQGLNKWLAPKFSMPNERLVIKQNLSNIDALQQDRKVLSEVQQRLSVETRKVIVDYNNGLMDRTAAILLLVRLGSTNNEAEILIQQEQLRGASRPA